MEFYHRARIGTQMVDYKITPFNCLVDYKQSTFLTYLSNGWIHPLKENMMFRFNMKIMRHMHDLICMAGHENLKGTRTVQIRDDCNIAWTYVVPSHTIKIIFPWLDVEFIVDYDPSLQAYQFYFHRTENTSTLLSEML